MAALVGLSDVKEHLNIKSATNDSELTSMLARAVAAIGDLIGPLPPASVSEEIDTHGSVVVLSRTPAISLTSVFIEPWLGADPIDDTPAWRLNTTTGVMRRRVVSGALPWTGPGSIFTITYLCGYSDIPEPVNHAILLQVAHMWQTQRGAMPLPAGGMDDPLSAYGGDGGFLHPNVMELLLPYLRPPGVG